MLQPLIGARGALQNNYRVSCNYIPNWFLLFFISRFDFLFSPADKPHILETRLFGQIKLNEKWRFRLLNYLKHGETGARTDVHDFGEIHLAKTASADDVNNETSWPSKKRDLLTS